MNYEVQIGPGSNHDGIDVRVWDFSNNLVIIQCKKVKDKIDKIIIKGLHSDIEFYNAKFGLIVTTSSFSNGARKL